MAALEMPYWPRHILMDPDRRQRLAAFAITILFLALVRTLSEIFRLKYVHGGVMTFATTEPFLIGALVAAIGCWLAVTLYFFRLHVAVMFTAVATVAGLLAVKFILLGF